MLVAMGDCAITGNVPSMRNPIGPEAILDRAYIQNASAQQQIPCVVVPRLLKIVRPIHEFVKVDVFLPGCPPSADTFHTALTALINGGLWIFRRSPASEPDVPRQLCSAVSRPVVARVSRPTPFNKFGAFYEPDHHHRSRNPP